MNAEMTHRGAVVSWQEPPATGAAWVANIVFSDRAQFERFNRGGSQIVEGRTRDEMIENAKKHIDGLLGSPPQSAR